MADKFDVIQLLFDSYNGEYTEGNLKAYVANLAGFSDQTVAMAVRNFTSGKVDRNGSFRPSSEELFKECDRIINGVASDINSPLGKFLAASKVNKIKTEREDEEFKSSRDHKFLDKPKVKKAGRILTDKTQSTTERLKALEYMQNIKTGSQFDQAKTGAAKNA
ncbi:MAG: hypothetical protein GY749_22855 [Desulfobacteraceae bacterium]|nr:hypothetical protein [Desulfobacteraceae bacterium]